MQIIIYFVFIAGNVCKIYGTPDSFFLLYPSRYNELICEILALNNVDVFDQLITYCQYQVTNAINILQTLEAGLHVRALFKQVHLMFSTKLSD